MSEHKPISPGRTAGDNSTREITFQPVPFAHVTTAGPPSGRWSSSRSSPTRKASPAHWITSALAQMPSANPTHPTVLACALARARRTLNFDNFREGRRRATLGRAPVLELGGRLSRPRPDLLLLG